MSDLATLQARRATVQAAYDAALRAGQETQHGAGSGARRLVRVDFDALRKELADLDARIAALTPRRRVFYVQR
jgi:hypothetical protein